MITSIRRTRYEGMIRKMRTRFERGTASKTDHRFAASQMAKKAIAAQCKMYWWLVDDLGGK